MPVGIVTGASRGLGLELARALVERGWRLVVDARGAEALAEATAGLSGVTAIAGDVAPPFEPAILEVRLNDQPEGMTLIVRRDLDDVGHGALRIVGPGLCSGLDRRLAAQLLYCLVHSASVGQAAPGTTRQRSAM